MKKALRIAGIVVGAIVLLFAIVALYFNFKGMPTYEVQAPEISIEGDSAQVARGEYLVNLSCVYCHSGEEKNMSGRFFEENDFGKIYAPNITSHTSAALGQYSDGELAYLLRTGIKRNGELALPMMPRLNHLSDEDLKSVIAYLRSGPSVMAPSDKQQPKSELSLLGKVLMNMAVKPYPYPDAAIEAPPRSDKVAYGRYVSTAAIHCYHCHSASFATTNDLVPEDSEGYMGGGNLVHNLYKEGEWVPSANLTFHTEHGIGSWTEEQFINAVRFGQGHDGVGLSTTMPKFTSMTEEDISAIWAYLETVPVIENEVMQASK